MSYFAALRHTIKGSFNWLFSYPFITEELIITELFGLNIWVWILFIWISTKNIFNRFKSPFLIFICILTAFFKVVWIFIIQKNILNLILVGKNCIIKTENSFKFDRNWISILVIQYLNSKIDKNWLLKKKYQQMILHFASSLEISILKKWEILHMDWNIR